MLSATGHEMKIAIVGGGISGLVAAYLLSPDHEVTVFEANDYPGGHTHTVSVELDGERQAIDTGFIVFNESNYPNFARLLRRLDVSWQPTSMSFSVRSDRSGLEYNGTSLNGLFAQRRNLIRPGFYRMLRDILRFHREAPGLLAGGDDAVTVAEYVEAHRYSMEFVEHYLVPLGSSLWSCPATKFREFPIEFVVEFLANHRMLQVDGRPAWQVIQGGSVRYVEKLTAGFRDGIRLSCPVRTVKRCHDHVMVCSGQGQAERFDHVILACHSDQALTLLADPSSEENEILGAFPYQRNEAVLHTDASVLPKQRRAWASWNYHLRRDDPGRVAVTYNMNMLQGLESKHVFCVTLNDDGRIAPEKVIRRIRYHHPVFTTRRTEAQRLHGKLIHNRRTSYCGAYWGYGFHEDGVNSALAVCRAFGKSF